MIANRQQERQRRIRIQARLLGSRAARDPKGYGWPVTWGLLLWVVGTALLHLGQELSHAPLSEGQRAPATLIAQVDFAATDLAATELARRQASDAILPVFNVNQAVQQAAVRVLNRFIDSVVEFRRTHEEAPLDPATTAAPNRATNQVVMAGIDLQPEDVATLIPDGQEEVLRELLIQSLTESLSHGIISVSERESLFHGVAGKGRISIVLPEGALRSPVAIDELPTPSLAVAAMAAQVRDQWPTDSPPPQHLLALLVRSLAQPNLSYDAGRTEAARQQAMRQAQTVTRTVRAGNTLITQGDRVTAQHLEDWRAHERRVNELRSPLDRRLHWIGGSMLLLFALVLCGGLLHIVRPDIARSPSLSFLLAFLGLLTLGGVFGLLYLSNTTAWLSGSVVEYLLPLSLAPLLAVILIGPATAVVAGAWTSFAAAVLFENSFSIFAMGLLVTIIVAHIARQIRKRSRMLRIGCWIGLSQAVYGLSSAFLTQLPANWILLQAGAAVASGVLVALVALILLPLFESLFDITTDITLLELSDMGHPLLQRMAIEAPGTYHHSLMVANLAQAAASEVGVNALLVRVCAYFHDVGKLTKPEFFVENIQFKENPHDDLTPSMSTLVIISHVKEGVTMARRAKLPQVLIEAIEQHHGTGLVAYFYHRAKTQQDEPSPHAPAPASRDVDEERFRYPGPKPRSVEMGILLLADSVEAASRSMEKPTPGRIENLVDDIVDARLQDDQLDDCDLTFAQLKAIKRAFVFALTNMLHGRVPYPKDEDRNNSSTVSAKTPPAGPESLHPPDHG